MSASALDRRQQQVNGTRHGGSCIIKATKGSFLWLLRLEYAQYFLKQECKHMQRLLMVPVSVLMANPFSALLSIKWVAEKLKSVSLVINLCSEIS